MKKIIPAVSLVFLSLFSFGKCTSGAIPDLPKEAIAAIRERKADCVIAKDGKIAYSVSGRGISPILVVLDEPGNIMQGAIVADKVVGRAAAAIAIAGGAKAVHGELICDGAVDLLEKHNVKVSHSKKVPYILNRAKNGLCPVETAVLAENDPKKMVVLIRKAVEKMKNGESLPMAPIPEKGKSADCGN